MFVATLPMAVGSCARAMAINRSQNSTTEVSFSSIIIRFSQCTTAITMV